MKFYYAEYDNELSHSSIHNMTLYIATQSLRPPIICSTGIYSSPVGYGCYIITNQASQFVVQYQLQCKRKSGRTANQLAFNKGQFQTVQKSVTMENQLIIKKRGGTNVAKFSILTQPFQHFTIPQSLFAISCQQRKRGGTNVIVTREQ